MALADWPRQMITPARALELAGDWPLYTDAGVAQLSQYAPEGGAAGQPDQLQVNLRCGKTRQIPDAQGQDVTHICGQSVGMLTRTTDPAGHAPPYIPTSLGDLLAAVLRHMVMAHDQPLSGAAKDNDNGGH